MKFAIIRLSPFLNNPKDLDLSYKMDLDFWGLFWKKKKLHLTTEEIWYLQSAVAEFANSLDPESAAHDELLHCLPSMNRIFYML